MKILNVSVSQVYQNSDNNIPLTDYDALSAGVVPRLVLSHRRPGPAGTLRSRCGTGAETHGPTGECGRPDTSFHKQALRELRGLSQRHCPARGKCWTGSAEGHGPCTGSRPPPPAPSRLTCAAAGPGPATLRGCTGLSLQPASGALRGPVPPAVSLHSRVTAQPGHRTAVSQHSRAMSPLRSAMGRPAPTAPAQEAPRETGTERGKGSPHGGRAGADRALLDWQPEKQIRGPE